MSRLADLAMRRPRRVLAATAVFFVVAAVFGAPVFGLLKSGNDFEDPSSQSAQARDQLQRAAGTQVDVGLVALVALGVPVSSSAAAAEVMGIVHTIRSDLSVASVGSFYQAHDRALSRRGFNLCRGDLQEPVEHSGGERGQAAAEPARAHTRR